MTFRAINRRTGGHMLFRLIGAHTSTAKVGAAPFRKPGCAGCRDSDAMLGTKPEGLSPEGVAARAEGIAQPNSGALS